MNRFSETNDKQRIHQEKNMKSPILVICALAMLSTGSLSFADNTADPLINARQHNQKHRVIDGVRSGELTVRETRGLAKQQRKINRLEKNLKADGHLSKRDRVKLHRAQNRASRNIYRQKHDRQRRK